MQYSLLNRFQGCLSGLVLGETLGGTAEPLSSTRFVWSPVVLEFLEQIVQAGRWIDLGSWMEARLPEKRLTSDEWAIATLPIALFFHDDLSKQRRLIRQTLAAWQVPAELGDRVITFAYAIAQALKGQLYPRTFVAQALTYLRLVTDHTNPASPWITDLESLQTRLANGAALALSTPTRPVMKTGSPRDDVGQTNLAIALYSVLSIPENVHLAMRWSIRFGYSPALAGALTGAIAGAYTSMAGIPPKLQVALSGVSMPRSPLPASLSPRATAIAAISTPLLAIWAGMYNPAMITPDHIAVTAPWVIRQQ